MCCCFYCRKGKRHFISIHSLSAAVVPKLFLHTSILQAGLLEFSMLCSPTSAFFCLLLAPYTLLWEPLIHVKPARELRLIFFLFTFIQEEAGSLLVDLSSFLNTISVKHNSSDEAEVVEAAAPIVEAASNILNSSSNVGIHSSSSSFFFTFAQLKDNSFLPF